jgi:hypothetical protein
MGESCGTGGGGSGGGGSGGGGGSDGCGGENIGVAIQALAGCCCELPIDGSPGRCWNVDDPSQCSYGMFTDGECNPAPGGTTTSCSLADGPGVPGAAGMMGLVVLATAIATALRRRLARRPLVPSGTRA